MATLQAVEYSARCIPRLFHEIVEGSVDAVVVANEDHTIGYVNAAAETLFGYTRDELIGQAFDVLIPRADRRHRRHLIERLSASPVSRFLYSDHHHTFHALRATGESFPVEISILKTRDELGLRFIAFIRDLTRQKELEASLERLASTDPLTGTRNRRAFLEEARKEQLRWRRFGEPLSLAMIDLDCFKSINDRFGHVYGDQVLKHFVTTVHGTIREVDIFGRWGGEEFALLLPSTCLRKAAVVAERIRECIQAAPPPREPCCASGYAHVTASIGVAAFASENDTIEGVINRADRMLYMAKSSGRNCVCMDSPGL